jgi:hypothetical protein
MKPVGLAAVLAVALSSFCSAQGGRPASSPDSRPRVLTPSEFLGHSLGETYSRHCEIVDYAKHVAAVSPRVRLTPYGRTPEGRELVVLAVTSPENHARRADLEKRYRKLSDPRRLDPGEDVRGIVADLPVVVWLSYNVHGNEASPSECALAVLHRLATAEDAETMQWLKEAIVLIDPCLNPDGRDRYVNWFKAEVGRRADPDPDTREHREPWPGGRTNHFQFDLNRDWAFATQVETRGRLPLFVAWTPHVHVDFHEMSAESTYFFFPAEKPINANFPPHTVKWGKIFGQGNAAAFDAQGLPFYTSEDFDLFYPGYGDSWPSFSGAIGMTYEMAGNSSAGAAYRRRDGTVLTLEMRMRRHELASHATIRTAVARRAELLLDYHGFRKTAIEEGVGGATRAFVIPVAEDPARADELVRVLRLQGIEVARARATFTASRVTDIFGKVQRDRAFEAGTWVVPLGQPLKRLAKTLLEPRAEIQELYFYDVSAWSLPLAYGVACFEVDQPPQVELEPIDAVPAREGGVGAGEATVGWLLDGVKADALFALADLVREGARVRVGRKPLAVGTDRYDRGALLVRRSEQTKDLGPAIAEIGRRRGARFKPLSSGLSTEGIDLGSASFGLIMPPRILLLAGKGIDATSFGSTRYVLDQVYDLPYSVIDADSLERVDLAGATAIVVPDGRAPSDKPAQEALKKFMNDGGVVVALGNSAFELASGEKEGAFSSIKAGSPKRDDKKGPETRKARFLAEMEAQDRKRQQPGSIFHVELDPAHPVAFGYRGDLAAFKAGLRSFDPEGPGQHVGIFKDAEPVSGYVNPEDERWLRGRSYLSVEAFGNGALVLFADDPNFRGAWHGMTRLFLNACLLLPDRKLAAR